MTGMGDGVDAPDGIDVPKWKADRIVEVQIGKSLLAVKNLHTHRLVPRPYSP